MKIMTRLSGVETFYNLSKQPNVNDMPMMHYI